MARAQHGITRYGRITRYGIAAGSLAAVCLMAALAWAEPAAEVPVGFEVEPPMPAAAQIGEAQAAAAREAWGAVYRVLMSPRCMNCHPDGDRPLQTDDNTPHKMNISRASVKNGLECSTCHRAVNAEALGLNGGPPGAPHWGLPAAETPLIFQGRTPGALCAQLKDPAQNGGRDLAALLKHVTDDKLVLWGWDPGGQRTRPPLSHADFVAAFTAWVDGGGTCPPATP